jgi:hypothetical protein
MPAWPTKDMTLARCRPTCATATSHTRCAIPSSHLTGSRIFGASDRGCERYDLRPFGLFRLCSRKSAILIIPARGRCRRKPAKCSRIRIATSFTVWRLGSTDFLASVIRIISWICCSTLIDRRVSVNGAAVGSSGEVVDTIESAAAVSSSEVVNGAASSTGVDSWENALNEATGPAAVGS